MQNPSLYIGLMSGTSADGIDLALVDFRQNKINHLASFYQPYDDVTKAKITALYLPSDNEIDRLGELNIELAKLFAKAIEQFLLTEKLTCNDIIAIGNHGQTIRHRPLAKYPFTLQIGCNQTLATLTNIRVVGSFRVKDMALGGQGAPLVPAFHKAIFSDQENDVVIVNIGGIANLTFLPKAKTKSVIGFDTGPGNAMLDDWYQEHFDDKCFDDGGNWAAQGKVNNSLLEAMLADEYFHLPPPKSTGREYFHLSWLHKQIAVHQLTAVDIQNTLAHLTAKSIADEINRLSSNCKIYLCGGGYRNSYLVDLLRHYTPKHNLFFTNQQGICPDSLEAIAFAWLAHAYDKKIFSNIPAVTGASKETVLGCAFFS